MKPASIKETVKEKYSLIARQNTNNQGCCGPSSCCGEPEFSMIGDEYLHIEGYVPDADLGLGCGLPTEFSGIKPGMMSLTWDPGQVTTVLSHDALPVRKEV
jgi:arsenite methyltransferase